MAPARVVGRDVREAEADFLVDGVEAREIEERLEIDERPADNSVEHAQTRIDEDRGEAPTM
jgi:hypothetical protein